MQNRIIMQKYLHPQTAQSHPMSRVFLALLAMKSFRLFETAVFLSAQPPTLTARRRTSLWPMIHSRVHSVPRHGRHVADTLGTSSRGALPCSKISRGDLKVKSKRMNDDSAFSVVGSPEGPEWLTVQVVRVEEARSGTGIPPYPISTMTLMRTQPTWQYLVAVA